jgi:anti-anti-sigma regulatory factor
MGIATPRTGQVVVAQSSIGHLQRDTTVLLKITTLYPDEGHCLLRLEGQLAGIWVEELQRQCAKELAYPRQLTLDMSGVQYLDQRAKAFLWELNGKDVAIESCSPFVSEQLRP